MGAGGAFIHFILPNTGQVMMQLPLCISWRQTYCSIHWHKMKMSSHLHALVALLLVPNK